MRIPIFFRSLGGIATLALPLIFPLRVMPANPPSLSETNLTVAAFESFFTNLVASTETKAELKSALTNAYHQALLRAKERDALAATLAEHEKSITSTTNQVAALRKEIEAGATVSTNDLSRLSSAELKTMLSQAEANEDTAKKALEKLNEEEKRRRNRLVEIPKQIAASRSKLDEIKLALQAKPAEGEAVEVTRANRLLLLTRKAFREQEVTTVEAEAKAYEGTAELLSLQTERQSARLNALAKELARLRAALATAGKREATSAAVKAAAEEQSLQNRFWQSFPALSNIASNNTALVDQLKVLNERNSKANAELTAREDSLAKLEANFKTVKGRVEAFEAADVRINQKVGELLREQRRNLADAISQSVIRRRLGEITDADLRELDLRESRRSLNIESSVSELIQGFVARGALDAGKTNDVSRVTDRARELLRARKDHLDSLADANKTLGETLTKLNANDITVGRVTRQFQDYVEERVLWVRSSDFVSAAAVGAELKTITGLLVPANWAALGPAAWNGLGNELFRGAFWVIAVLVIFAAQRRVRGRLRAACETAGSRENTSLAPTWIALLMTVLIAAPLPVVFWALSAILESAVKTTLFVSALGKALGFCATIYFTLGFFRHAARQPGLGSHHFNWSEDDRALVRRHLNWFLGTAVTLTFLIALVEGERSSSEARLSYLVLTGALTIFCWRLLHPVKGLTSRSAGRSHETWRRLRFLVCILVPLALGFTSLIGYHFTAIELGWRLVDSIWLVLGIVLMSAVLLRWFYLERKRIALEKLDLRKAASEDTVMINTADQALAEINITEIKEQTRSLLRVLVLVSLIGGLWTIWSDVTPALNILDRKALWHVEVTLKPGAPEAKSDVIHGLAAGVLPDAGDTKEVAPAQPKKILQPITITDVLFAVIVLIIMVIAARNLPSFLEILILKHLKLETGGAYAITTIVQYVVVVVGIVVACSSIGLSWEKVQWLAAAVTLGIGFGLQEIFANFVAGIILLFERPVRVGDVITVGNTTGVVSRIRIRATTITNWERQELVLPNKDLITGSLTNWTLSDTTNRVVITVGVAYGSDTRLARQILEQILADSPVVMKDPRPRVTFDLFGESSLNFTVRAFISNMDDRLNAIHGIHTEIDDRFKEANIEISFPQRDLHIRSGLDGLKAEGGDT